MRKEKNLLLLVEDDAIIALYEKKMLTGFGYDVITAHKPEQVNDLIEKNDPDLVLMDIDLGRNQPDGTEVAREILKNRDIPIVFCTSHAEKEMVDKVKGITRYGYILKNSGEFVIRESIAMAFELYNAHHKTKESEEKYKAAFMTSPDAVNINSIEGMYLDINEGFTSLTGFTREDSLGRLSSEINIWAIPEDREKMIQGLMTRGFVTNLESLFRCKDGSFKTGIMSARIIQLNNIPHILSITRDITDRKKAEDLVEESRKKYRNIIQGLMDGFWLINIEGKILEVNESYSKMSGYTKDEITSMHIWDLDAEEDEEFIKTKIKKLVTSKKMKFLSVHKKKDGSLYNVEISTSYLKDYPDTLSALIRKI